jgi:hypothetical protein
MRTPARLFIAFLSVFWLSGCSGGLSARTKEMRTALDAGDPQRALAHLNRELKVKTSMDLPRRLRGDDALLVLDRATIQQSVAQLAGSKRDYQAADAALDVLDLSHGAGDTLARWTVSDSASSHAVVLEARGHRREGSVAIAEGGWGAVTLFALR